MRSRNILWRIVLLSLLFYSAFSFFTEVDRLDKTRCRAEELFAELAELRLLNSQLCDALEQRTQTQLQELARERLGLVVPGEKVFYFTKHRED